MQNLREETKLVFFRHGETKSNVEGFMQGISNKNTELTIKGIEQSKELGDKLFNKYGSMNYVLSSGKNRITATLDIISKRSNFIIGSIIEIDNLKGIVMGDLTGRPFSEFISFLQSVDADFVRAEDLANRDNMLRYINTQYPNGDSRGGGCLRVVEELILFYEKNKDSLEMETIGVCIHSSTLCIIKGLLGLRPLIDNSEFFEIRISDLYSMRTQLNELIIR